MRFLCTTLLAALLAFGAAEATERPGSPAAERLAEVQTLIDSADPQRIAAFIASAYSDEYAQRLPLGTRIDGYMNWKARGGMRLVEVTRSEPFEIETVMHQAVSDERWRFSLTVESEPPHRITAIRLGREPLPAIDPPLSDEAAARRFIDYTASLAGQGLFSGAVLIARHGELLAQDAWGLANRDFDAPNTIETRFNLGSINKTWTAVAIAQLVEAGKLSFDTPVSSFIDYPDAEAAEKIRIEHLLTHTSGLGNYFTEAFDSTARKNLRTIDDFLALSRDQELAFEPGAGWQYSNTGMMLLGKIIELASGQDYDAYLTEHLFDPADMTRSGCFALDEVNDNLAVGYFEDWTADGLTLRNNLFHHVIKGGPAGGCYSTVGDLFRFAEALKAGDLVSRPMMETLTTGKPALDSPHYGYGFGIHPGRVLFGHNGGFLGISANLDITVDPEGWVIVVLANDDSMRAPVIKSRQLIGLSVPE